MGWCHYSLRRSIARPLPNTDYPCQGLTRYQKRLTHHYQIDLFGPLRPSSRCGNAQFHDLLLAFVEIAMALGDGIRRNIASVWAWNAKAEIFAPSTNTWTPLPWCIRGSITIAVLLPDGRVLSAGGVDPSAGAPDREQHSMEIKRFFRSVVAGVFP